MPKGINCLHLKTFYQQINPHPFVLKDFLWNTSLRHHLRQCQFRARDRLIEDGMNADEAAEAVQPPLGAEKPDTKIDSDESDEEDSGNPHKLRKCSVGWKKQEKHSFEINILLRFLLFYLLQY